MAECSCTTHGAAITEIDPMCTAHGTNAQPLPVGNNLPVIHRLVQADLQQRLDFGVAKYGQPLQAFNGRNSLRDAYEEALDMTVYLRTALFEQEATVMERMRAGVSGGDPDFGAVLKKLDPTGKIDNLHGLLAHIDQLHKDAIFGASVQAHVAASRRAAQELVDAPPPPVQEAHDDFTPGSR